MTENNLHCPECDNKVTKAGSAWSGRKKYQQFRCHKCGRSTIRPLNDTGNQVPAQPFENKEKLSLNRKD